MNFEWLELFAHSRSFFMSTLTLALKSFHDLFYHLFWKFDPQSLTIFDLFGLIICLFINLYLFFKPITWKALTDVKEGGKYMIEPPFLHNLSIIKGNLYDMIFPN